MFPFSLFYCSFMTENSSKINSDDLSLGIDNPVNQKKSTNVYVHCICFKISLIRIYKNIIKRVVHKIH